MQVAEKKKKKKAERPSQNKKKNLCLKIEMPPKKSLVSKHEKSSMSNVYCDPFDVGAYHKIITKEYEEKRQKDALKQTRNKLHVQFLTWN